MWGEAVGIVQEPGLPLAEKLLPRVAVRKKVPADSRMRFFSTTIIPTRVPSSRDEQNDPDPSREHEDNSVWVVRRIKKLHFLFLGDVLRLRLFNTQLCSLSTLKWI